MIMNERAEDSRDRMAETIRKVLTHRERAPRSPRMERALKRLIWRYSQGAHEVGQQEHPGPSAQGKADR